MTITKIWCLAALAAAFAAPVNAALTVDTGAPDGSGFPLLLDSNDWLAGQVTFTSSVQIDAINVYLDDIGNGTGTFTLALYADDNVKHLPENLLNSVSATFTHAGWNGAAHLDWSVGLGTYWIAIEGQDPFNGGFIGVMPVGAPAPLTHTAFNDSSGYRPADGLSFGLQVDTVAAIPEPATYAMLLTGLGLLGWRTRRIGN